VIVRFEWRINARQDEEERSGWRTRGFRKSREAEAGGRRLAGGARKRDDFLSRRPS
jgi:hypothetical protein